jgi:hypothetical protein
MANLRQDPHTQRGRLLGLLVGARGSVVPLPKILALGIAQYNARIFELRRLGFSIQSYKEGGRSFFRLAPGPSMPTPVPIAPDQGSLFPDMTARHIDDG